MTESIETTEADARPWEPPTAPATTAMEPLPVTAVTIEGARKILARLCNSGRVRMTVPPRDDDEDMVLLAIIELAALTIAKPAAVLRPAPVQLEAEAAPVADAPPLKGLAHFHYRLEAASGYEQEGVYNNITADVFGRVIAALEGARDDGRAAPQPTQGAPATCRLEDGRCGICGGNWSVCGCDGMLRRAARPGAEAGKP